MRHLLAVFCCYFAVFSVSVQANEQTISDSQISTAVAPSTSMLIQQLVEVKLSKSLPLLERLEAEGGTELLPLFKTLLEGRLYFIKSTKQVVAADKTGSDYQLFDLFSGETLGMMNKKQIKKIRVNNKLRVFLRGAIARLDLKHPDADKRLAAVKALLTSLDSSTLNTLEAIRNTESDEHVLAMIDLALALDLSRSPIPEKRLAAVTVLGDSLESDSRNRLNVMAESDPDTQVKQAAEVALKKINERIEFYDFVDQLFFGLSLGSVLLLAAIGLAITFGVMGVINMAHGEMIMLGAYTTYVVQLMMPEYIEYSLWVAIPAAFVVSGLFGILIERGVIRHLHGRPLETLLATFGISLILQQLVRTVFSPLNRQVESPLWMSGSLEINPVLSLTFNRLYILAFALLVFGLLLLILRKTSLGLNVRAVSQNRSMAKAMGIRTDWVDAMTFGLGSGIAGIAGVALSQLTNVGPNLGQSYIIDSFMVVVFGGVGNLWGTLVAAFSLGVANKFLEPVTGAVLASILVLVFIILFIQKKPKGLFPQKGRAAE
ncbi:urea ABC transporter permease subunit UrtB [uncultured Neptuniibacter sp.]|uniref:urea ABC transporter permease subunit UrtB n=1 Tax=uncultured Neptuniibacter sp. TaxID=502143 RepID=UPI002618E1A7|nr:urea ABC transporter permease subunit UrtB [uncultured Neptuniibacter sp.]